MFVPSSASKPPNSLSRQNPASSIVLFCLLVADLLPKISTQLPVHGFMNSSPLMLLYEWICSLSCVDCVLCSSSVPLLFCKSSALISDSGNACQIASPGCPYAERIWASSSFSLYATAVFLCIDGSTLFSQPYSLLPIYLLAAEYRPVALFLDGVQK